MGESKGIKESKGKTRWSLLPFDALEPVVSVLNTGATSKYAPANWKFVKEKGSYVDGIHRHWVAYVGGEEIDTEMGESHLACVICNALFLIWDRQQKQDVPFEAYLADLLTYPDYVTDLDVNKFD